MFLTFFKLQDQFWLGVCEGQIKKNRLKFKQQKDEMVMDSNTH